MKGQGLLQHLGFAAVFVVIFLSPNSLVHAQSFGFGIGEYRQDEIAAPECSSPRYLTQERSISVEIYLSSFLKTDRKIRPGIRFFRVHSEYKSANSSIMDHTGYTLSCFLTDIQWRFLKYDRISFVSSLGCGFSVRSHFESIITQYDLELCFQPGLGVIFRLFDHIALHGGIRYNYIAESSSDYFPFSNGLIFEFGLHFEHRPKVSQE